MAAIAIILHAARNINVLSACPPSSRHPFPTPFFTRFVSSLAPHRANPPFSQYQTETQFKQSGLTLAVTSPVISAIQTAQK
jgi:hypothetical protein